MKPWPKRPLGLVSQFIHGVSFKPADLVEAGAPDSLPCFRTKNVQTALDENDLIYIPRRLVKSDSQIIRQGDILISTANSNNLVGKCCFVPRLDYKATLGGFIADIRANPAHLHARFLYYWLSSPPIQERLRRLSRQTTNISNLPLSDAAKEITPVPPLAEQERIVKLLDEADELRKLRAQADRRTAGLIPALFHDIFGNPETNPKDWPSRSFEEVIASTKLGLVRGAKETDDSLPFAYVRMDAILGDGRLALEPMKRVNATAAELAEYSLKDGDLLFNTRNSRELVGKTALFEGDGTFLFNNNIMRIRFKNTIEPRYAIALFQSDFIKRQLEARKSGTTSVVAIYFKNLRDLKVPVPPAPLQKEFARRVTEIRELEAKQAASRKGLDALFQSMLHRAFRGEL